MLRVISIIGALFLVSYLAYEAAVSPRKYRHLKRAIAERDARARTLFYKDILWFEWVSAFLAFAALEFDVARFNPAHLQAGDTAFGRWWIFLWHRAGGGFLAGLASGIAIGIAIAAVAIIIGRRRVQLRQTPSPESAPTASSWQILPDFSALIPIRPRERVLFACVAISAGICEEIVYRAWLLDLLHGAGLTGATLVIIAALLFGIAHYYQGYAGAVITSLVGFALCVLYIASGTILVPMLIHALVDLRIALFPTTSRAIESPQPQ
jgi:membrane protease YdiL (CAAX protease family)